MDMRKALIVGIDYYDHVKNLSGCVNDAHSVQAVLERNADGNRNFPSPRLLTATGKASSISKASLKQAVRHLFTDRAEIALFYFAGHGHIETTGGYICASDCRTGDDGLPLAEIMTLANKSPARNKVIILDSCHSGVAADNPSFTGLAEIGDGVTILTASTAEQYALESPGGGSGVYTTLLVDALNGSAANLVGDVTPGSIYAHIDQSLGPWAQRPVFKTNVETFVSLRKCEPPIPTNDLRQLTTHFPSQDSKFFLDPSFEPERFQEQLDDASVPPPDAKNTTVFGVLQKYARVNLVRPVDAPHMWHAAMQRKPCELTLLGRHYWSLVKKGLI